MKPVILLVDDDDTLGKVLSRVLERQGLTVYRATTVDQALQVAEERWPQLALLDLCLPDGDGVQLARKLRTKSPGLALILMTAFPLRLHEDPTVAAGFQQVLTKPLNLQELRHVVQSALGEALTAATVAGTSPESPARFVG